jgi:hypothetical protein
MDVRAGNDRVAERAEHLQFVSRVPMLCECSAPGCRTIVMISLPDYHEVRDDPDNFLTAPGHTVEGAEGAALQPDGRDYTIQRTRAEPDEENGDRRFA